MRKIAFAAFTLLCIACSTENDGVSSGTSSDGDKARVPAESGKSSSIAEKALQIHGEALLRLNGVSAVEIAECGSKWRQRILSEPVTEEVEASVLGLRIAFKSHFELKQFARISDANSHVAVDGVKFPLCATFSPAAKPEPVVSAGN